MPQQSCWAQIHYWLLQRRQMILTRADDGASSCFDTILPKNLLCQLFKQSGLSTHWTFLNIALIIFQLFPFPARSSVPVHYQTGLWVCCFSIYERACACFPCTFTLDRGSSCRVQDVVNLSHCCFIVAFEYARLHCASLWHPVVQLMWFVEHRWFTVTSFSFTNSGKTFPDT